jgi:MFS family permease
MDRARRPFAALLLSTIVSLVGSQFTLIALPWFVLTTTGSTAQAGLVGFATLLPGLIAGLFGGILVDRIGFRRVAVIADGVSGASILAIPVLYDTLELPFGLLLVLVFAGSLLKIPSITAHRAMTPELAARAGISLDRANATFESLQNLAVLVGTPLAGVTVSLIGARHVLYLDAASFAVSALLVLRFVPDAAIARPAAATGGILKETMAGLAFIRRDALLWPMAILLAAANAVGSAVVGLLLPVYAEEQFGGAGAVGLAAASTGAGAFLGATLYGMWSERLSRRLVWGISYFLLPVEFWVFTVTPGVALLMAAFFVAGVAGGPLNPLMVTIRHERSPHHLRGRVFSTYAAIAMAAAPFGILASGVAIEQIGFLPTVLVLAITAQGIGVIALLLPAFRAMEPEPVTVAQSTGATP